MVDFRYFESNVWDNPAKRSVGLFTDLRLFYDALDVAAQMDSFSKEELEDRLSKRVKGLIFIEKLSPRVLDDLVRELTEFGWIYKHGKSNTYHIDKEGINAIDIFQNNHYHIHFCKER